MCSLAFSCCPCKESKLKKLYEDGVERLDRDLSVQKLIQLDIKLQQLKMSIEQQLDAKNMPPLNSTSNSQLITRKRVQIPSIQEPSILNTLSVGTSDAGNIYDTKSNIMIELDKLGGDMSDESFEKDLRRGQRRP